MATEHERLETSEDLSFERRWRRLERAAQVVGVALVVLAILGFSGAGGPLSRATTGDAGFRVDYPRVMRQQTPEYLVVELRRATPPAAEVSFAGGLLRDAQILSVQPEPDSVSSGGSGTTYRFAVSAPRSLRVVLRFEHRSWGADDLVVRAGPGGAPVRATVLVLP
ncbi:MAG: hypothetical protein GX624_03525 [Actinobacteria bacterium]|nr:hypothetical protein [Actinomycetota bacterium]